MTIQVALQFIVHTDCYFFPVCDPDDLRVPPPFNDSWSDVMMTADGLGVFTFSGGNVTFDGVSYGSVATYTTTGDYRVIGEQSVQSICESDEWLPPVAIIRIASTHVHVRGDYSHT